MKQKLSNDESEGLIPMEWPHITKEMVACLRPIWEGYPTHPVRFAHLNKSEKRDLRIVGLQDEIIRASELNKYFSIHGTDWKKRSDEAINEFLQECHRQ